MRAIAQVESLTLPPDGTEVCVHVSSRLEDHADVVHADLVGVLENGGRCLRLTRCDHAFGACKGDEYCLKLNGWRWGLDVWSLKQCGPERCNSHGPRGNSC